MNNAPQQPVISNWKANKTNKILLLIVQATLAVYILWGLGALLLTLVDDSGDGGLLLIPLLLAIWVLTPIGLVSLLLLAIRTKKALFIGLSALVIIGVAGFFAYDIFVVLPKG